MRLKDGITIEEVRQKGAEYKANKDRLGFAKYLWDCIEVPMLLEENFNTVIGGPGFGFVKDNDGTWLEIPHIGGVVIGENVRIGSNCCIDRGTINDTIIGDGTKIDNLVHIAHNCNIGKNCIICAGTVLCGSVTLEDDVWLAPGTLIREGLTIGKGAKTGLGAVVVKNVPPGALVYGVPAKVKE